MKQFIKKIILFNFLGFLLASCNNFEKDLDLELPTTERKLVVECYLRPNEPFRVLLTESKGYFDSLNECPTVKNATVIIEYNNIMDTLKEAIYLGECSLLNPNFIPFFDNIRSRFYNYGSNTLCPLDFNTEFKIHVYDNIDGRSVHASTKILEIVPFDSISYYPNNRLSNLHANVSITDNTLIKNYYRLQIHQNSLFEENHYSMGILNVFKGAVFSSTFSDEVFNGNGTMVFDTNDSFKANDTIIATLYHLTPEHYNYLSSISRSLEANGNPFAQAPTVVTNIQGGLGIFTGLSFKRDTLIIQ